MTDDAAIPTTDAALALLHEGYETIDGLRFDGMTFAKLAKEVAAIKAEARAAALRETADQFPWTQRDGHTLWRTRGTTNDEHDPRRCAKDQGIELPDAAEALRDTAGIDVERLAGALDLCGIGEISEHPPSAWAEGIAAEYDRLTKAQKAR